MAKNWRRSCTDRGVDAAPCPWIPTDVTLTQDGDNFVLLWTNPADLTGLDHWEVILYVFPDTTTPIQEDGEPPSSTEHDFVGPLDPGSYWAALIAVPEVGDPCVAVMSNSAG